MKKFIWVTSSFVALHRWKEAPPERSFLTSFHRHVFHVKLTVQVAGSNREIEFFDLKARLESFLKQEFESKELELSCEHMAEQIAKKFRASSVSVSEDNENGATIIMREEEQKTRCFVGTEAEGPYRGKTTLFIPGCVTRTELAEVMERMPGHVTHVYYGAGNIRFFLPQVFQLIRDWFADDTITIETDYYRFLPSDVASIEGLMIVSLDLEDLRFPKVSFVKELTDTHIIWIGRYNQRYYTRHDDELFATDTYV